MWLDERRRLRDRERAAIAELAMGALGREWVLATELAELIGCSVQALHVSLAPGVAARQFEEKKLKVRVSTKAGFLNRAAYRRAATQPIPLPAWLEPMANPLPGSKRQVEFLEGKGWDTN